MAKQKTIPELKAEITANERQLTQLRHKQQPLENQAVFYGTHPAIIEQEIFDKVQEIRQQRQSIRIFYDLVGFIPMKELMKQKTA